MVGRGAKRMIEFNLERNALVSSEQKGSAKRMHIEKLEREAQTQSIFLTKNGTVEVSEVRF